MSVHVASTQAVPRQCLFTVQDAVCNNVQLFDTGSNGTIAGGKSDISCKIALCWLMVTVRQLRTLPVYLICPAVRKAQGGHSVAAASETTLNVPGKRTHVGSAGDTVTYQLQDVVPQAPAPAPSGGAAALSAVSDPSSGGSKSHKKPVKHHSKPS